MKTVIILIASFSMMACATPNKDTPLHVIEIQVPCPAAAPENRPPFPPKRLANLDPNSPGEVVKAFAISITEHRAHAQQLDKLLDACK